MEIMSICQEAGSRNEKPWKRITIRGVVGRERVGTAFPHLFYVLL